MKNLSGSAVVGADHTLENSGHLIPMIVPFAIVQDLGIEREEKTMELIHVSDVLSPFLDKTWLTDEGRDRGSFVHLANANYARGVWMPKLIDDYQGYFESFRRWFDKYVKKVHLVETTLEDPDLGFCGTIDIIVTMIDGIITLPDYKTGKTKMRITLGQVAAYKHLARKNGFPVERTGALYLKEDGAPAVFDWYQEIERDFLAFIHALNAYRYFVKEE